MEGTCSDVRAVCIEGVCGKDVVDSTGAPTDERPTPSPTMEATEPTPSPTIEATDPKELIMSESESIKLEVDFTMAWIASPDAGQVVLEQLPALPGKFEIWIKSTRGKKMVLRRFEQKLDLIIEEISDLEPRGIEDEQ